MSQQPSSQISKAHFVGVIHSLHQQYLKDKASSEAFGQIFNTNDVGFYDNNLLINSIFSFLHEAFPKDDDGHSEIEHYCYTLQFGKLGDEYESPEQLYDRLMLGKGWMTINTVEHGRLWFSPDNEDAKHYLAGLNPNSSINGKYPIAPEDAFILEDQYTKAINRWAERETKRTTSEMYESAKTALDIISGKPSPDETH